jgi:two-component system response regulator YesN
VSRLYKVLIIDDESIIRKGLSNIINWSQLSCEICGEAADGISGIELIKQVNPDIILTDIRMPKADGLVMIRQAKEIVPECKIIILTGYRDFNYAQEAIKLGAFDFILKPTKIEELTGVIIRSIKDIEKRKVMRAEIEKYREQYEKNIPVLRERLLYNLIHGLYPNETDINQEMRKLNLSVDRFVMGMIDNESSEDKDSYSLQLYQFALISSLEEIMAKDFSFLTLALNNRCLLFLAGPHGNEELDLNNLQEKLNYLQEMIDNCFDFTISIAISSPGNGYRDLPIKFRECKNALEHRFYLGRKFIDFIQ